jgi:hypothetical protein
MNAVSASLKELGAIAAAKEKGAKDRETKKAK